MKRKRVIYILGLGRSGTTLLDAILGNANKTFSCGELNRYPFEEGIPYQFPENHPSALFWDKIRKNMLKKYSSGDFKKFQILSRKFDYHLGFLGNYFNVWKNKKDFKELLNFNEDLYLQIFEKSKAEVLIDSSKYANRALFLSSIKKFDVSYIYLKRDPINVVKSFGKTNVEQGSRSWLSANYYYFFASMLCHMAFNKLLSNGFKGSVVKHEQLLINPKNTFDKIGTDLNINVDNIISILNNDDFFKVGELYYGNRVRLKMQIKLIKDTPPKKTFADHLTQIINHIWY